MRTVVLTDVEQRIWLDRFELDGSEIAARPDMAWSIKKYTMNGGLAQGVDVIEVNNGRFAFTVVPTRGMGLWKGTCDGCSVGWNSPVRGPVNPMFINALDRGGLGWLQGFDECIVRCGLESNGAPGTDVVPDNNGNPSEVALALHGKIANLPASKVAVEIIEEDGFEIAVTGVVEEGMLFCPQLRLETRISTKVGSNAIKIEDRVTNMKGTASEFELLYHCNFGEPFLGEGSTFVMPLVEVAPRDARATEDIATYDRYLAPTAGYVEQCYFCAPKGDASGDTIALLRNAAGDKAVSVRFNISELPCFTQWKNTASQADGYVTGLEPGVNYPNLKTFERKRGRVGNLGPGASHTATMVLAVHADSEGVKAVEAEIAAIQGESRPVVHPEPIATYSDLS